MVNDIILDISPERLDLSYSKISHIFVGESPHNHELSKQVPFCGPAGLNLWSAFFKIYGKQLDIKSIAFLDTNLVVSFVLDKGICILNAVQYPLGKVDHTSEEFRLTNLNFKSTQHRHECSLLVDNLSNRIDKIINFENCETRQVHYFGRIAEWFLKKAHLTKKTNWELGTYIVHPSPRSWYRNDYKGKTSIEKILKKRL